MTERVAIVTGAARGIGAAIAARLAASGAAVGVIDLKEADTAATVETITAAGGRALGVGADVSDVDAVTAAVDRIATELGAPTILVNNAGILRDSLLFKMTDGDWDAVIGVHLRGAFLMSRAVQSHMVAAKWGRIVNLSSTSALGNRGQANYSAAKAGTAGLHQDPGDRARAVRRHGQRDRARHHRDRHAARDGRADRHGVRRLPRRGDEGRPGASRGHARGHRGGGRVLLLGGGVVRQRPGALRGRRPEGLSRPAFSVWQTPDMRLLSTAAAGFVTLAVLTGCVPADPTPPPSVSPTVSDAPAPPSDDDIVMTVTAVMTAPNGAVLDLTIVVHRPVAFDAPASDVAREAVLDWCSGELDAGVVAGQGFTFATVDVESTVRSGDWPTGSPKWIEPYPSAAAVLAVDGDLQQIPGPPHCAQPANLITPGSGHLYLGFPGDVDGDGDGTPASGAWAKLRYGVLATGDGLTEAGFVLSECTATITPAGEALGAPTDTWQVIATASECTVGTAG